MLYGLVDQTGPKLTNQNLGESHPKNGFISTFIRLGNSHKLKYKKYGHKLELTYHVFLIELTWNQHETI